jgi:hypothetical protein
MEELRIQVTDDQILSSLGDLSSLLNCAAARFILNMDEMGYQDWADRMDSFCSLSAGCPDLLIHVPVPRTGK